MDFQEKLLNFDFVPSTKNFGFVRACGGAREVIISPWLTYSYRSRGGSNKLSHAQIL